MATADAARTAASAVHEERASMRPMSPSVGSFRPVSARPVHLACTWESERPRWSGASYPVSRAFAVGDNRLELLTSTV
jgi:hypothetical protein